MTATVPVWWMAGNTLAWLMIVVVIVVDIRTIRRGRRRTAEFQHAFAMLALYIQDADLSRPLPLAVTEYLRVYNTPQRRRRRAI